MPPVEPSALLHHLRDRPTASFRPGEMLIESGKRSGKLLVLREGQVELSSEGVVLGAIDTPGAMMGEVSALLGCPHIADLRALAPTVCHVVDAAVLNEDPVLMRHVAIVLAQRLETYTQQLVALRHARGEGVAAKAFDQSLDQLAKAVLLGGLV